MPEANTGAAASELRESLRALIGPDVLLETAAEAQPFLTDYRGLFRGRALAVALPRDLGEVSKLLAWSHARQHRCGPAGRQYKLLRGRHTR